MRDRPVLKGVLLAVESGDYWMHVEMPSDTPLGDFDRLLRETWLECCGHLSSFTVGDAPFTGNDELEFLSDEDFDGKLVSDALALGGKLTYAYDFGDTTLASIRFLAEIQMPSLGMRIRSRNWAPDGDEFNSPRTGAECFDGEGLVDGQYGQTE